MNIVKREIYFYYWLIRTWSVRKKFPKYAIMSLEETIKVIVEERKSISRLGDADFLLLIGARDVSYQVLSKAITERLQRVVDSRDSRFLVCLPDTLINQDRCKRWTKIHWKSFVYNYGARLAKCLDSNYVYGNSNITRIYMNYQHKENSPDLFQKIKTIWDKKHVVLVEGKFTRFGVGNDLLDNALSIKRIIGPHKNAFESIDLIKSTLLQYPKEGVLFLFSLGPTATILCHELAIEGYWAVDIGNLDLEYMWMKAGAKQKISIKGRFSVETSNSVIDLTLDSEEAQVYEASILLDLSN
jgi:glycosyltransferase family protein